MKEHTNTPKHTQKKTTKKQKKKTKNKNKNKQKKKTKSKIKRSSLCSPKSKFHAIDTRAMVRNVVVHDQISERFVKQKLVDRVEGGRGGVYRHRCRMTHSGHQVTAMDNVRHRLSFKQQP